MGGLASGDAEVCAWAFLRMLSTDTIATGELGLVDSMNIFIFDMDSHYPAFCPGWTLARVFIVAVLTCRKALFLVVRRLGLVRRHGIQPIHCQINSWTGIILSTVDEPLEDRDNDDDSECSNAVI